MTGLKLLEGCGQRGSSSSSSSSKEGNIQYVEDVCGKKEREDGESSD